MKQKTIITELFADIEKFGWNAVRGKINFYRRKEKQQIKNAYDIEYREVYTYDERDYNKELSSDEYYIKTYGEEESN